MKDIDATLLGGGEDLYYCTHEGPCYGLILTNEREPEIRGFVKSNQDIDLVYELIHKLNRCCTSQREMYVNVLNSLIQWLIVTD